MTEEQVRAIVREELAQVFTIDDKALYERFMALSGRIVEVAVARAHKTAGNYANRCG